MHVMDGHSFIAGLLADDAPEPEVEQSAVRLAFTIKKFVLGLLLERAAVAVPNRDVMPVLKHFQVEARPGRLRVVASDLELSMITTTDLVTVETPGVAVLPARKMQDIIREAADGDVTIVITGDIAEITIGRTSWRQKLLGGDDYPPMPEITEATFVTVDRAEFLTALKSVRYAACKEAERSSLMMIDVRNGKMTACDGSRFQQATVPELPFDFQIPIGAVNDLVKLLQALVDLPEIAIGDSQHHLIFRFGADVFVASKLVAQFPDMEALLLRPALENKHELVLDRDELRQAIKRTRINADPQTSAIALLLDTGTCTVQARDKYHNYAAETIEAGWTGPARTIVVNHGYLTDMINMHAGQTLKFRLGEDKRTAKSPIMLRDLDAGTTGVLQQMILDWVT